MITRKTIALTTIIATLAFGSGLSRAAGDNDAYMETCRSEIEQYYGEERSLAIVSKRRIAEGTRVKIAARSDNDNAEFINCWIPNVDTVDNYDSRSNAFAATVTPVPVIR
ncbi:MAG: hypothetical protein ABJL54_03950 [Halioglobus sp.]